MLNDIWEQIGLKPEETRGGGVLRTPHVCRGDGVNVCVRLCMYVHACIRVCVHNAVCM